MVFYTNWKEVPTTVEAEVNVTKNTTTASHKVIAHQQINQLLTPEQVHILFVTAKNDLRVRERNNERTIGSPKGGEVLIFDIKKWGLEWQKQLGTDSYRWKNVVTPK